jgi:hypothetical protein
LLIDGLSRRAFIQAAGAAVITLHPSPGRHRRKRRRPLSWSGYSWTVRPAAWDGLPGPNRWSAKNVTVKDGTLRLEINRTRRGWTCAEIQSRRSFGYGRYEFVVNSNLARLDPWVVLGLFTYSDDMPHPHNEIDIEVAKWGIRRDRTNTQFVEQRAQTNQPRPRRRARPPQPLALRRPRTHTARRDRDRQLPPHPPLTPGRRPRVSAVSVASPRQIVHGGVSCLPATVA